MNDECRMTNAECQPEQTGSLSHVPVLEQVREALVTAREGRDQCLRLLARVIIATRDAETVECFGALRGFVRESDLLMRRKLSLISQGMDLARNDECRMTNAEGQTEQVGSLSHEGGVA